MTTHPAEWPALTMQPTRADLWFALDRGTVTVRGLAATLGVSRRKVARMADRSRPGHERLTVDKPGKLANLLS
jgi:hypothetical protein